MQKTNQTLNRVKVQEEKDKRARKLINTQTQFDDHFHKFCKDNGYTIGFNHSNTKTAFKELGNDVRKSVIIEVLDRDYDALTVGFKQYINGGEYNHQLISDRTKTYTPNKIFM